MTPEEEAEVLGGESERVEWKESDRDVDEILHAACALANDLANTGLSAYIALGLRKDGSVLGVDTSDQSIQRLVNRLQSTKILPSPSVSVEALERDGRGLLIVRVTPYQVPPVVKVDGVAWVRVGTTTRRATEADLARLHERRPENRLPFDQRAVATATLDDLALGLLREEYAAQKEANHDVETYPSFDSWLAQREITRKTAAGGTPTAAGLLVFGIGPHRHLPGATIEFVRYAEGGFDSAVVLRKTIVGSLPDQLTGLWAQLQAQLVEVPTSPEGIRTPFASLYPADALRELARNLVQHRLYEGTHAPGRVSWLEDRIVFNNPGARFGRASEGDFGEHSDYRNPTVTRFLVERGYVEKLGRGIQLVRSLLARNGNPPLEAETDGFTTVTVRKRP